MFPVGIKVVCVIQALISFNGQQQFIADGKALGRVVSIQDSKTLVVNFSKYANEKGYIGDYSNEPVFQKNCVPIVD